MRPEHSPQHELLLEKLLMESEDPLEDLGRSELSNCAECRAEVEDFLRAHENVEQIGLEARDVLADANRMTSPAPGEALVDKVLGPYLDRAQAETGSSHRPEVWAGRLRRVAGVLLGVAALFLVAFFLEPSAERDSNPLGNKPLRLVSPVGEVTAWEEFTWEATLPPGGSYGIRIQVETPTGTERELVSRVVPSQEPRYVPARGEIPIGVERLSWEVRVLDASGDLVEIAGATTCLSLP